MRIIGLILTLLLIIVGITFAALNAKSVAVNYLIGTSELPLAVVLLVSLIFGILISAFILGISMLKLMAQKKWLESKLKRAQEQLAHRQAA